MLFNFCDPRLRPEIQCSNVSTEGYEVTNLITGTEFLGTTHTGFLFCPSKRESIPAPANFLKCFTKSSLQYLTTCINSLRICICKTKNSVPALDKIEVWGTVSPRCGKDTITSISTLWFEQSCLAESMERSENAEYKTQACSM